MRHALSLFAFIIALAAGLPAPILAQEAWLAAAFGLDRPGSDAARDRWDGLRTGGRIALHPPEAVARLVLIAGPESGPAGNEPVHLVVLGLDAWDSVVADGTAIRILPGDGGHVVRTTLGGIADLVHTPGTVTRGFVAGAETDTVQSLRATYRVTSDLASVRPRIAAQPPVVSETQAVIRLPEQRDRYGDPAEDGTGLTIWLTDDQGRRSRLDGDTTAGAASRQLLVRQMSGALTARATLGSATSTARRVESEPLRSDGPPPVHVISLANIGAQRLVIGPFRTAAGHLLPDGMAGEVCAQTRGYPVHKEATWVLGGMAEMLLPCRFSPKLQVIVESPLGRLKTTTVINDNVQP